jgi:hypothetical protein
VSGLRHLPEYLSTVAASASTSGVVAGTAGRVLLAAPAAQLIRSTAQVAPQTDTPASPRVAGHLTAPRPPARAWTTGPRDSPPPTACPPRPLTGRAAQPSVTMTVTVHHATADVVTAPTALPRLVAVTAAHRVASPRATLTNSLTTAVTVTATVGQIISADGPLGGVTSGPHHGSTITSGG